MHYGKIALKAVQKSHEIGGAAFRLYCAYVARRHSKTGICFPGLDSLSDDLKMSKSQICQLRKELVKNNWIEILSDGSIKPIIGFEDVDNLNGRVDNLKDDVDNLNRDVDNLNPDVDNLNPNVDNLNRINKIYNREVNREVNKEINTKEDKSSLETHAEKNNGKKGRRWGDDELVPDDWKSKMKTEFPAVDVETESRKFENYWASRTDKGATKKNWQKTFENWIISENQRAGRWAGKPQPKTNTQKLEEYDRYFDELEKKANLGRYLEQAPTREGMDDA